MMKQLGRGDLRPYQNRAVSWLKSLGSKEFAHDEEGGAGLFLDMGLGKTVSTLTALSDLIELGDVSRVLLVGPLSVVQGVWAQEAKKWEHTRHLSFKHISGDEAQRLRALKSPADVHLINVENFVWLLHVLKYQASKKNSVWPYDTLVIDESSMFKTPKTKRFSTLRHVVKRFKRRFILTGTPTPNNLLDVWSQVFILDEGKALGPTVTGFKERFFSPAGFKGKGWKADETAAEKVAGLISSRVLTLRAEDWLDLPPLVKNEIWVDLPPRARDVYDRFEKEMFLELDGGTVTAVHAGAVSKKCHQLANGSLYLDKTQDARQWELIHDAKIEALKMAIDGTGSNVLVAYYFKPDLERLRKVWPKAPVVAEANTVAKLSKLTNEWNDKKHPVMFIHPQGNGHGLNFQHGGHALIFFSLLFGHEPYRQVIERIGPSRQVGIAKRVIVSHILARDTVDVALLAAQRRKFDDERGFIRALKEYRDGRALV